MIFFVFYRDLEAHHFEDKHLLPGVQQWVRVELLFLPGADQQSSQAVDKQ